MQKKKINNTENFVKVVEDTEHLCHIKSAITQKQYLK